MSQDEDNDRPLSIASLRSRFENLAATGNTNPDIGGRSTTANVETGGRLAGLGQIVDGKKAAISGDGVSKEPLAGGVRSESPPVSQNALSTSISSNNTQTRLKPVAPPKPSIFGGPAPVTTPISTIDDGRSGAPLASTGKRMSGPIDPDITGNTPRASTSSGLQLTHERGPASVEGGGGEEATPTPSVRDILKRYQGSPRETPSAKPRQFRMENAIAGPSNGATRNPSPPRSSASSAFVHVSNSAPERQKDRPPSIRRTSTDGRTSHPVPLSPPIIVSADPLADIRLSASPESTPILAPTARPHIAARSASPTPLSTRAPSPSPKPPEPNRSTKPSQASSRAVSPIQTPADSEDLGQAPRKSHDVHIIPPTPPPSAPPNLPSRKTSPAMISAVPPPVPSRPKLASVASAIMVAQAMSVAPKLPARTRGPSVGNQDAPKLPSRLSTVPPSTSTQPAGASPGRSRALSGGLSISPSEINGPDSAGASYRPPPPPTRHVMPSATLSTPPRRQDTRSAPPLNEGDSDDDEDGNGDTLAPAIPPAAKRMLEEAPDTTHANRRPPSFVPDIRISGAAHSTAFAVHGRHVCTGSHVVRVYDTLMADQPIHYVDLNHVGLEFRVKEPRVTAMCFRPAATQADEGRYLWCGTKDGHLWELDIRTGVVTDTRPSIHASAVLHIFRYKNTIMSLEEGGKLHVFEVGMRTEGTDAVATIPLLARSMRVTEKFNFAKLVCGRLWISSGPASRSTTSAAASKGPTIRIYEPCSASANTTGKTVWTTEWTGAVTSATVLPFEPTTVYLGHEGGFISVWNAEELSCEKVLKVSTTDILSLEGVGERLWAGNRRGQIHTYDVSSKPWRTTNLWTAHPEHSVHHLAIDPWSIEETGRFTLWSVGKDSVRAWDGLLSVDWIDSQMTARQADYSDFRDIRALVCSWNIDSAKPTDLAGTHENSNFLPDLLHSVHSPEIIVFGFQEVIPLTDKKLTAKTLLFGSKSKDSGSSGDKISHAYRHWTDKLTSAVRMAYPDTPYSSIHSESLVGLFTCVFIKQSEREYLRDVDVTTVKRGIGGIYGNKGAIVARIVLDDTSICFINVHLAAGQSAKASRTVDLSVIMEDKAILPMTDTLPFINGGNGTAILDHELVILNGDLNYRIDQRRENVLSSIQNGELAYLFEHDQLRKEMTSNHAFRLRSFEEAPITFKPTYKYNPHSVEYDSSEKRRIPAWCDRILYNKTPRLQSLHYKRYEPTISDHRPISAGFKMQIKAVDPVRLDKVRKEVRSQWAKREAEMLQRMEVAYLDMI